jgi:CheY-like chemotaxis protein
MTKLAQQTDEAKRTAYYLTRIEESGSHLLGVINDVLDMSKIEAGKLDLAPVCFNLQNLIARVNTIMSFKVEEKDIDYCVALSEDLPANYYGDSQRLAQVITNLLSNAEKFTPKGGRITFTVELEQFIKSESAGELERSAGALGNEEQGASPGGVRGKFAGEVSDEFRSEILGEATLLFSIRDNGIGIPEAEQQRLFSSFVQVESQASRKYGGTGLGLAISKNIVEMMQGNIWVTSTPGTGSTFAFRVRLPVAKSSAIDDAAADAVPTADTAATSATMPTATTRAAGETPAITIDARLPQNAGAASSNNSDGGGGAGNASSGSSNNSDTTTGSSAHRLLLAEDVEVNREILLAFLEPYDLVIDSAETGAQVVEMYRQDPESYDLIFMDVQMPGMDGLEATRLIRASGTANATSIPIIAMTANVFREDVASCLAAGMNGHIGKPIDIGIVMDKLQHYLGPVERRQ